MSLIDQHEKIYAMELQLQVAAMISQGANYSPLRALEQPTFNGSMFWILDPKHQPLAST